MNKRPQIFVDIGSPSWDSNCCKKKTKKKTNIIRHSLSKSVHTSIKMKLKYLSLIVCTFEKMSKSNFNVWKYISTINFLLIFNFKDLGRQCGTSAALLVLLPNFICHDGSTLWKPWVASEELYVLSPMFMN